jgi:uncharacterized membrane protein HdeD (DUF308 family)
MLGTLMKNWWVFLVQGILAILCGIATLAWPGLTLIILLWTIGIYFIVDAITSFASMFKGDGWFWPLLGGLVSLAAGIATLARPGVTAIVLLIMIGIWALVKGITEIVTAIQLRKAIEGEFWLILSGLISALFGLFVIFRPGGGALAVLTLIAVFLIIKGLILVLLSFKVRGVGRKVHAALAEGAE